MLFKIDHRGACVRLVCDGIRYYVTEKFKNKDKATKLMHDFAEKINKELSK